MSDLISRQEAIDFFKNCYTGLSMSADEAYYKILYTLRTLPSVEPERTAKVEQQGICWENIRHYKEGMCASCGRNVYDHAKYCDECGARLEWNE